jgi:hypothetical protein
MVLKTNDSQPLTTNAFIISESQYQTFELPSITNNAQTQSCDMRLNTSAQYDLQYYSSKEYATSS